MKKCKIVNGKKICRETNPFKLWQSWVGALSLLIFGLAFGKNPISMFLGKLSDIITQSSPELNVSVIYFIIILLHLILGFILGYVLTILYRRVFK